MKTAKPKKSPAPTPRKKAEVIPIDTKPVAEKPKAEKITDPVLPIAHVHQDYRDSLEEFARMVAGKVFAYNELKAELEGDDKNGVAGYRELLRDMLKDAKVKGVEIPWAEDVLLKTTRYASTNTRISEDLLLANGVSADIIKASKESKPYVTVKVSLVRAGSTDDGD
jgi:hypothetical protein